MVFLSVFPIIRRRPAAIDRLVKIVYLFLTIRSIVAILPCTRADDAPSLEVAMKTPSPLRGPAAHPDLVEQPGRDRAGRQESEPGNGSSFRLNLPTTRRRE
jgi:hypothetical protein